MPERTADQIEKDLRDKWTADGVPQEKQDAIIADLTAKAQPGVQIGPFVIDQADINREYANLLGYSDVTPYEVISKTAKTILIREMEAVIDPQWSPKIIPGGFVGHCVNQDEQKWLICSNGTHEIIRARLRKDGYFWSRYGKHKLSDKPIKYYDYNF